MAYDQKDTNSNPIYGETNGLPLIVLNLYALNRS